MTYDLAVLLLNMSSREVKIYIHAKISTWMVPAALFIKAKKVETTHMFIIWWIEKQNLLHAHNEIVFNCNKTWNNWYILHYRCVLVLTRTGASTVVGELRHDKYTGLVFPLIVSHTCVNTLNEWIMLCLNYISTELLQKER